MFKKILLTVCLFGWSICSLGSFSCPEKRITENAFVDSVYQSLYEAGEKVDVVLASNIEDSENIIFFKRSFRTKILIQKIKEKNFLALSAIGGGVFVQDVSGEVDLHLIGSSENNTIASFSPSPNQIITIGFNENFAKSFFPGGGFFDPVINSLQNSAVVDEFPQLLEKKIILSSLELNEGMMTETIAKTAEAICLRYQELQR